MEYAIFDTETTGLRSKDEVIQFTAFLTDDNFRLKKLYNFYCYTNQRISKDAIAVHHLDRETLMKLSHSKYFEDYYYKYTDLFNKKSITWVGWNVKFDMRLCNQTLCNNGLFAHNFGTTTTRLVMPEGIYNYDLMQAISDLKNNGRRMKLSAAMSLVPYSKESIDRMFNRIMDLGKNIINPGYHNALYDAFCTWLILKYYSNVLKVC